MDLPGSGESRLAAELVLPFADSGRARRAAAGEYRDVSTGTSTYHLGVFAGAYGHPTGVGPGDVGMLFDFYLGRWRSDVGRVGPTLLWVDDAPHVDDLSASLLRQAVDGLVQLVLIARSDDVKRVRSSGMSRDITSVELGESNPVFSLGDGRHPAEGRALSRANAR